MVALTDFSPYILPFADGCPEFVIQDAVLATIQDYYQQTSEKEVELPVIDIVATQNVYTLTIANAHAFRVTDALYEGHGLVRKDPAGLATEIGPDWRQRSGTPAYFYMPGLDQIRLAPTPETALAGGLFVVCTTYPSRSATSFDEVLIEEMRDAIVNGALSRLLMQQDQKWTDVKQGVARGFAYQAAVNSQIRRVAHGRVRSKKRVVGHYF